MQTSTSADHHSCVSPGRQSTPHRAEERVATAVKVDDDEDEVEVFLLMFFGSAAFLASKFGTGVIAFHVTTTASNRLGFR